MFFISKRELKDIKKNDYISLNKSSSSKKHIKQNEIEEEAKLVRAFSEIIPSNFVPKLKPKKSYIIPSPMVLNNIPNESNLNNFLNNNNINRNNKDNSSDYSNCDESSNKNSSCKSKKRRSHMILSGEINILHKKAQTLIDDIFRLAKIISPLIKRKSKEYEDIYSKKLSDELLFKGKKDNEKFILNNKQSKIKIKGFMIKDILKTPSLCHNNLSKK